MDSLSPIYHIDQRPASKPDSQMISFDNDKMPTNILVVFYTRQTI